MSNISTPLTSSIGQHEFTPQSDEEWTEWITTSTAQHCHVPADYGLARIAQYLGPTQIAAHALLLEAVDLEADGEINGAMKKYAASYRKWPSLDCVLAGGIPVDVRQEALAAGYLDNNGNGNDNGSLDDNYPNVLLDVVDIPKSQASIAVCSTPRRVLDDSDLQILLDRQQQINTADEDGTNNPENLRHAHKTACMLNNPPHYPLQTEQPAIVGKILQFAEQAWREGDWSGPGGPLEHLAGVNETDDGTSDTFLRGLSIRVIELWEYEVGGGLTDAYHYDTDSIVTIVVLLSNRDDFDGGDFRTFEAGEIHKTYALQQGEAVAFVSHKYHNITELTRGCRRSLVMELWQGGVGHEGR